MHYSLGEPFYFELIFKVQKVKHWSGVLLPEPVRDGLFCDSGEKGTVGLMSTYCLSFHTPL